MGSNPIHWQPLKENVMQQDDGSMIKMDLNRHPDQIAMEKNPDLTFEIGETVKVKGGDFRVKSFGKRFMMLEGLPGTRMRK